MNRRDCRDTAEEIRALRQRLGLPMEALAWKLGVSYNTVWSWEHGRRRPKPYLVELLRLWAGEATHAVEPER